jgi:2-polyprenyl-6-hydroxyphenyl methylase/3-demethylubiquinone-9 3-methyltransferase
MTVQRFDKYERDGAYHWTQVFGPWWRPNPGLRCLYTLALKAIKQRIPLNGARGLDVGCGEGVMLRLAAELGSVMFGLDGMELPLVLAQSLCTRPSRKPLLVRGDAHTLPFRPGVFDFATCIEVIEHLERPTHLLEELRRVLRPGG